MEDPLQYIDERIDLLYRAAKSAADEYWGSRQAGNECDENTRSNLGCRVIPREGHFVMVWYTNSYSTSKGKTSAYSKHIKKGKKTKAYAASVLKGKARDWEFEQVLRTERIFAEIREELSRLQAAKRALKAQISQAEKVNDLLDDYRIDVECLAS